MSIPDEAVEAAAIAYIEARSPDVFTSPAEYAAVMLEAAAPIMLADSEWAIFPMGGPARHAATDLRYETREAAEETRKESYLHPELFEVRGRAVGEWSK